MVRTGEQAVDLAEGANRQVQGKATVIDLLDGTDGFAGAMAF
jgi:hypothetical protein